MNKTTLMTSLALSSLVTLSGCNDNPFSAKPMQEGYQNTSNATKNNTTTNKKMENSCGGNHTDKKADAKCGEGKCGSDKKADAKCGEGKCGSDKKADAKCGEGKCGSDKKADAKCGEGKCGGNK